MAQEPNMVNLQFLLQRELYQIINYSIETQLL